MHYTALLVATAAFTGLASAQNYSTSGPLMVDPNSVDLNTRLAWCRSELNTCPMLCGGQANPNTCDAATLTYNCTCSGGVTTPNITNYQGTLPFFICQRWIGDCTAAHPNDLAGQTACQSVQCGMANASEAQVSMSSSSSSASATQSSSATGTAAGGAAGAATTSGGSSATGSSTASSASASSSRSAAVANVAKDYGFGVLAAGMLAAFGLAL
ncbi:hypothetical protein MBLNU457_7000t1 [Dothideomycetes sp. NU457]